MLKKFTVDYADFFKSNLDILFYKDVGRPHHHGRRHRTHPSGIWRPGSTGIRKSRAKSPQQMFGAVAKTYAAEKLNIKPADMFVVSVMPCTAKKYECDRPEFISSGYQDVDAVITTRELAQMIKAARIDFMNLPDEQADKLIGESTGAATIFGATGGVMEAALRTAYEILSGQTLAKVDFTAVRGLKPVREASVDIPVKDLGQTLTVNVCVVTGLKHVKGVIEDVLAGRSKYHFIEVMNCPGGCINGGGQPIRRDTY